MKTPGKEWEELIKGEVISNGRFNRRVYLQFD